ncbi:hypothetical protein TRFO_21808 [Tritrichomonas foetus]|uniref:Uncharacterized protein n=1 Tax=Tritrichomonas foetus TaxID=1144522 RepID=A0A1J4KEG4_9EUKA|nr:hypothetical protein TRFO_21808 [Tritrichomonas foetus]|eukprot:OHT09320.1 hypothetical protein TRFO_21808 [Tritrichomonas foetus]
MQTLTEEMLLNIKFVPSLIFKYKLENSIDEDEQIKCVLSVDAASFSPQIKIDGIESINLEKLTELNDTWKTFESL